MSPAHARVIPFALYILLLIAEQYLPLPAGWDGRWLYPVKIGLVVLALLWFWRDYSELRRLPSSGRHWAWALGVGVGVFVLWINLDWPWATLGTGSSGYNPTDSEGRIDPWLVAFRLLGAAAVVPIMEELFWRSFIMRWLHHRDFLTVSPAQISRNAMLITVALFAVEHHLWLAGLCAGLAYNLLYMRTGNLWYPIIAHALTNGLLGIWVVNSGQWQFW